MEEKISLSEFFEALAGSQTLPELFFRIAEKTPNRSVYSQFEGNERIAASKRYSEVAVLVRKLAQHLSELGVGRGDRVAICSRTRPEWLIADLAILSLGAVSVAVYQTLNLEEMAFILADSGSSVIFAENQSQLDKTLGILEKPVTFPAIENRPAQTVRLSLKKIITFEKTSSHPLTEDFETIINTSTPLTYSLTNTAREDIASIVYTSGTTGIPKGVIQTHGNHLSNLFQATRTELFGLDGDIFLFLPLAHSFARLIGYIGFFSTSLLKFPKITNKDSSVTDIPSVMKDLQLAGAQVVPTVPRILEKIKEGIEEKAQKKTLSGKLLKLTIANALSYFESNGKNGAALFLLLKFVRKKIKRAIFGSNFEHIVSGGAKLPIDVCNFFLALEITVYQGYGLTETCVATNVNLRDRHKPGSVGPCLYGVEIKVANDGEILFRGPNIAVGYWRRPVATADSWDRDGFFHTGDLGSLDEDGFLWITGRKKELIVGSNGKKIVPGPIEDRLVSTGVISQVVMIGDERSYCAAIIVPKNGLDSPQEEIQAAVDEVNKTLSKHEEIKKFVIASEEFSLENGLLTPTMKVRRNEVAKRYAKEIDQLYR
jgi:long-chain acyl-CoA synthetase